MAEIEHTLILERTMGGRVKKVSGGGWASGTPPYGYMLDEEGEPVVNPDEQKVIFAAAELMINRKMSRGEAAKELNALGYRTRTGKLWEGNNLVLRLRLAVRGYVDFTFSGMNEDGEEVITSYRLELPELMPEDRRKALATALEDMKGAPTATICSPVTCSASAATAGTAQPATRTTT